MSVTAFSVDTLGQNLPSGPAGVISGHLKKMMKKFSNEDVVSLNQLKSSTQRAIRSKILQTYPRLEHVIDDILPKKTPVMIAKCHNHVQVVSVDGEPRFFQQREGAWIPTLRILHKYPSMMPKLQVDHGAIRFVLRGSNIMCPGLTSPGGRMEPDIPAGSVVQIVAEGKINACGLGITTMSTEEISKVNKGVCVEAVHTLGDGLWNCISFS